MSFAADHNLVPQEFATHEKAQPSLTTSRTQQALVPTASSEPPPATARVSRTPKELPTDGALLSYERDTQSARTVSSRGDAVRQSGVLFGRRAGGKDILHQPESSWKFLGPSGDYLSRAFVEGPREVKVTAKPVEGSSTTGASHAVEAKLTDANANDAENALHAMLNSLAAGEEAKGSHHGSTVPTPSFLRANTGHSDVSDLHKNNGARSTSSLYSKTPSMAALRNSRLAYLSKLPSSKFLDRPSPRKGILERPVVEISDVRLLDGVPRVPQTDIKHDSGSEEYMGQGNNPKNPRLTRLAVPPPTTGGDTFAAGVATTSEVQPLDPTALCRGGATATPPKRECVAGGEVVPSASPPNLSARTTNPRPVKGFSAFLRNPPLESPLAEITDEGHEADGNVMNNTNTSEMLAKYGKAAMKLRGTSPTGLNETQTVLALDACASDMDTMRTGDGGAKAADGDPFDNSLQELMMQLQRRSSTVAGNQSSPKRLGRSGSRHTITLDGDTSHHHPHHAALIGLQALTRRCLDSYTQQVPLGEQETLPAEEDLTLRIDLQRTYVTLHPMDSIVLASNVPPVLSNVITLTAKGIPTPLIHERNQPLVQGGPLLMSTSKELDVVEHRVWHRQPGHIDPSKLVGSREHGDRVTLLNILRMKQREAELHFGITTTYTKIPPALIADEEIASMRAAAGDQTPLATSDAHGSRMTYLSAAQNHGLCGDLAFKLDENGPTNQSLLEKFILMDDPGYIKETGGSSHAKSQRTVKHRSGARPSF